MYRDPRDLKDLQETFQYNDSDSNGRLGFDEFKKLLDDLDGTFSDEEARIGFREIDTHRNGFIEFDEFVEWWQGR